MKFNKAAWTLTFFGTAIHLFAVRTTAQENSRSLSEPVAGTYTLTVCRTSCDASVGRVLTSGTLVLEKHAYALLEIPDPARGYFDRSQALLIHEYAGGNPNACFVFPGNASGTLAGTTRVGLTRWTRSTRDTLDVRLYQSPDAGYDLRLRIGSTALDGQGESWGPWPESENSPLDVVIARRIGPPDRNLCIRAAEHWLQELRRR